MLKRRNVFIGAGLLGAIGATGVLTNISFHTSDPEDFEAATTDYLDRVAEITGNNLSKDKKQSLALKISEIIRERGEN